MSRWIQIGTYSPDDLKNILKTFLSCLRCLTICIFRNNSTMFTVQCSKMQKTSFDYKHQSSAPRHCRYIIQNRNKTWHTLYLVWNQLPKIKTLIFYQCQQIKLTKSWTQTKPLFLVSSSSKIIKKSEIGGHLPRVWQFVWKLHVFVLI